MLKINRRTGGSAGDPDEDLRKKAAGPPQAGEPQQHGAGERLPAQPMQVLRGHGDPEGRLEVRPRHILPLCPVHTPDMRNRKKRCTTRS